MFLRKIWIVLVSTLLVSIPFSSAITAKEITQNNGFSFQKDPATNKVRMLRGNAGALRVQKSAGESTADSVKRQFAPHFGIKNPATDLTVIKEHSPSANRQHIRYQQRYKGIPVIGAELVANLSNQQLISMSGETSTVNVKSLVPTVNSKQAQNTAIAAVAKWYAFAPADLNASSPELKIYDPALIGPGSGQQRLVWQLTVTPTTLAPVKEYVLVDAERNVIVLHFNQIDHVLSRETYTAISGNIADLPGTLVCTEVMDPTCVGSGADAQSAHQYAADSYNFYFTNHGRDSLDDNGMTIVTTVNFGNVGNAFWTDSTPVPQMGFGPGFALADDVVAHEYTHGVTNNTSNLFYYYQSGAISESLSDVWGEFVDLTNTGGTDGAPERWLLGEDIPGGAIRSMANPPDYGDPDRMVSANYVTGASDNGGVHSNSGVNNKAVSLMVDGGSFNGQTITAIGLDKTADIYYEVQTNYLISGSDYLDLYNGLNQSCQNLIGTNGITSADCTQVNNALLAVEMNQQPVASFNPEATICPGAITVNDLFFDDMENTSAGNWGTMTMAGSNPWSYVNGYATSGSLSFGALPGGLVEDVALVNVNPVVLPSAGAAYLHFDHVFDYELNPAGPFYFDGGMLEYSIDNGATWVDAGSLIDDGRTYTGTLAAGFGNTQEGRSAFVGPSHGYNSTRLNLSSLTGNNIQIRFRHASDSSVASLFWSIDNVRVYTCGIPPVANAGPDLTVDADTPVNLDGSNSSDSDSGFTYSWTQASGTGVTLTGTDTATPSFTSPQYATQLTFQLTTSDPEGNADIDTVTVTVNGPPAPSGGGGGGGCTVSENGRFDPIWLSLLLLLSLIHLRRRRSN